MKGHFTIGVASLVALLSASGTAVQAQETPSRYEEFPTVGHKVTAIGASYVRTTLTPITKCETEGCDPEGLCFGVIQSSDSCFLLMYDPEGYPVHFTNFTASAFRYDRPGYPSCSYELGDRYIAEPGTQPRTETVGICECGPGRTSDGPGGCHEKIPVPSGNLDRRRSRMMTSNVGM